MQTLYNLTKALDKNAILGDIVECGVNKGWSAGMLATASENSLYDRTLWLFDSFMGLPKPSEVDGPQVDHRAGTILGSEDKVLELMEKLAISPKRVRIVSGWFENTVKTAEIDRIGLLHLDADLYESTKLTLETFYDRVSEGGYVVLDDYGDNKWKGARLATDEFISSRHLRVEMQKSDRHGYWFQKI